MIASWLYERRQVLAGVAEPIAWAESADWRFENGVITHRTGGFFSIAGVRVSAPGLPFDRHDFAMIDQPEIGLLGFLRAPGPDGAQWLLQAKSEPGSVEWVQVGPTVQATRSNYLRRHGGKSTRFLEAFIASGSDSPKGKLQSEQGSRFLSKYNCNAIEFIGDAFDPGDPNWAWFSETELRRALGLDFTINTDARSVLASFDWSNLRTGAAPFRGPSPMDGALGNLRTRLAQSHARKRPGAIDAAQKRLRQARASARINLTRHSVVTLRGWTLHDRGIMASDDAADHDVLFYRIRAPQREIEHWDQPFLRSKRLIRAGLVLKDSKNGLVVALRLSHEPGFGKLVQYGPSFQSDAPIHGRIREDILETGRTPELHVNQSDEGGRFMQSVVRYEIHVLPDAETWADDDLVWLTLGEAEELCRTPGLVTNEGRSAFSVMLSLA